MKSPIERSFVVKRYGLSFIIGFLTGIFSGLLGIGGGVILVPLIGYFYNLVHRQAQATSMALMVFTGIAGGLAYASHGAIDYFAGLILMLGAFFPVRVGIRYSHAIEERKLKRAFGFFLIVASIILITKPYIAQSSYHLMGWNKGMVLLLIGIISGFLSGMLGIGGGVIMIPAMVFLGGMSQVVAQGSALLCIVPTNAMGAFMHRRLGNLRGELLPGLIFGVFLGTCVGGSLACYFPEWVLRCAFAAILAGKGIAYIRTLQQECTTD